MKKTKAQGRGDGSASRSADSKRGSPEAVEKRRAARAFNDVLLGRTKSVRDGRTERRRRRLLKELADGFAGKSKRELKPVEVLSRVQELLELGEPLGSIKKACPPRRPIEPTEDVIEGVRRLHRAYAFPIDAYRFVGLDEEALRAAGVLGAAKKPGLARGKPRREARRGNVA